MNDDEYRDLIERAHELHELQLHPGWAVWNNHLRRRLQAKEREIRRGFDTLQEYRYVVGWIEGAEYALDALGELERQKQREVNRRTEAKAAT